VKYKNKTVFISEIYNVFCGPRNGRYPEIDVSVLECLKDLRNKGLHVTREALMSKTLEYARNSNIPFKASCGWCEKFMKRGSLSLQGRTKISQKLFSEFETKLIECERFVIGLH
jgi:hypothetical protein